MTAAGNSLYLAILVTFMSLRDVFRSRQGYENEWILNKVGDVGEPIKLKFRIRLAKAAFSFHTTLDSQNFIIRLRKEP